MHKMQQSCAPRQHRLTDCSTGCARAAACACHCAVDSRSRCCSASAIERRSAALSARQRASFTASASSAEGVWVPREVCFTQRSQAVVMASTHA